MHNKRPNILIFMTDQEQGQISLPGHPCHTPNADRLAKDGLRFTQCYTPAAHCCPSRASFMTGMYPSRHGVYNNVDTNTAINDGLNKGIVTFSELLSDAGYSMRYAGKWHVSNTETPEDRGWKAVPGCTYTKGKKWSPSLKDFTTAHNHSQKRERGVVKRPGWGDIKVYGTSGQKYEETDDYKMVHKAMKSLESLSAEQEPWCLFIGPLGPHDPFIVPEEFARMYDPDKIHLPASYYDEMKNKPNICRRWRKQLWSQLTESEVRESIAHYWGYCTMMDRLFGEVLDTLKSVDAENNTLVVRVSDHGEYGGAHGLYAKGAAAYREAYQVPLIMRWPEGISARGKVHEFITHMDFLPTFLELAGIDKLPENTAGQSLSGFFNGEKPDNWRDAIFTQFNGVELYYTQRAVQTKTHKYVYNGYDFDELYDLTKDPDEMFNIAEDPACSRIKKDLVRRMWQTALDEDDMITNPYWTVALAPWGPGITASNNQEV